VPVLLNVCVNTKPEVFEFAIPESKVSPVPHIVAADPPVPRAVSLLAVCGRPLMVHRTVSPAEIVVWAATTMPPVLLVQSTNPISVEPAPPQGGAIFPISTSKIAAMVREAPMNAVRLNIKSPMKKNFLFISIHPLI
jgi:hypothetical protein